LRRRCRSTRPRSALRSSSSPPRTLGVRSGENVPRRRMTGVRSPGSSPRCRGALGDDDLHPRSFLRRRRRAGRPRGVPERRRKVMHFASPYAYAADQTFAYPPLLAWLVALCSRRRWRLRSSGRSCRSLRSVSRCGG
jgi:hypothetical protein